jgi:hypothetical protein
MAAITVFQASPQECKTQQDSGLTPTWVEVVRKKLTELSIAKDSGSRDLDEEIVIEYEQKIHAKRTWIVAAGQLQDHQWEDVSH